MARAAPRQMQAKQCEAARRETARAMVGGCTRYCRCLSWADGDNYSARGWGCWGAGGGVGRREVVEVKGRGGGRGAASLALVLAHGADGDDHGRRGHDSRDRNRCCLKAGCDAAPGK
jgi:hypothetical protein